MNSQKPQEGPVPKNARLITDWIFFRGNGISRDTIKSLMLSQEFPYIEDELLENLKRELSTTQRLDIERIRARIKSISTIRALEKGFIARAIKVIEEISFPTQNEPEKLL